jgi:cytoskeletal protein RodZ
MNQDELLFEEFLAARMRDKGITLKRLAETTGIAPSHLENMLHGNFDEMPSTPYFRGYVIRVGKVLDFDGEEWWKRLKQGNAVKNSGPTDALPKNRFLKKEISNGVWAIGIGILILVIYLIIMFPRITGKPAITVTYPPNTPFTTSSNTITLAGSVSGADDLYLSSESASSSQEITIAQDGSWQETVLLGGGLNSFELSAKKLLGGEADVTEEIIYQEPTAASSTSTSTTPSSTATSTF